MIGSSADALAASNPREGWPPWRGRGCKGPERPLLGGMAPGKGSGDALPFWPPWNGQGPWGQESPQVDGCRESEVSLRVGFQGGAIAPMIHGSVQVERDVSRPCE